METIRRIGSNSISNTQKVNGAMILKMVLKFDFKDGGTSAESGENSGRHSTSRHDEFINQIGLCSSRAVVLPSDNS